MKIFIFIFFIFLRLNVAQAEQCKKTDQSINMCQFNGFCSTFPLGNTNGECGALMTLNTPWKTYDQDCISNEKTNTSMSCINKGIIKKAFCGKEICYICVCG